MKKLILFLLLASFTLFPRITFGQVFLELNKPVIGKANTSEEMVTQHHDIELTLGNLKISSIFLYQDESAPYQGYLIKFNDFLKIETLINNYASGCAIVVDELTSQCNAYLELCRKDCNTRLDGLLKEKDHLEASLIAVNKDLKNEEKQKVLWSALSGVAGVGIGVLIFNIVN